MIRDLFIAAGILLCALAVPARGQQGTAAAPGLYDARTVTTITGQVISIRRIAPSEVAAGGIVILLRAGIETVPVFIFPQSAINDFGFQVRVNDPRVTVTGSRVVLNETDTVVIIAAEVTNGDQFLRLRNPTSGTPAF